MTDYLWDAAADGDADVDTNWDPVGVPGASDNCTFNANSVKNCNWNIASINNVTVAGNAYTGTITQTETNSAVGGYWQFGTAVLGTHPTWNMNSYILDVAGTSSIFSGAVNISGNAAALRGGTITINATYPTVTLDGSSPNCFFIGTSITLGASGRFVFANNSSNPVILSGTTSAKAVWATALPTWSGKVAFAQGANYGVDFSTNSLAFNPSTAEITCQANASDLSDFTMNAAGTLNLNTNGCSFDSFNQTAGTATPSAAGTTVSCSGNWTYTGGVWTDNRGALTLDASGNLSHTSSSNTLATITQSGAITTTLTGIVRIKTQFVASATGTISGSQTLAIDNTTMADAFDHNGVTISTGVGIQITYAGVSVNLNGGTYYTLIVRMGTSTNTTTATGDITINGDFHIITGTAGVTYTFDMSTYNMNVTGSTNISSASTLGTLNKLDLQNGTHDLGSLTTGGTIPGTLDCTAAPTVTVDSYTDTANATWDNTGAATDITSNGDFMMGNNGGTWIAGSATLDMAGTGSNKLYVAAGTSTNAITFSQTGSIEKAVSGGGSWNIGTNFTISGGATLTVNLTSSAFRMVGSTAINNWSNSGTLSDAGVNGGISIGWWSGSDNSATWTPGDIDMSIAVFNSGSTTGTNTLTLGGALDLTTRNFSMLNSASSTNVFDTGTNYAFDCTDFTMAEASCTYNCNNSAVGFAGNFSQSNGTFTPGGSMVTLSGSGKTFDSSSSGILFYNTTISGSYTMQTAPAYWSASGTINNLTGTFNINTGVSMIFANTAVASFNTTGGTLNGPGYVVFRSSGSPYTTHASVGVGTIGAYVVFRGVSGAGAKIILGGALSTTGDMQVHLSSGGCELDTGNFAVGCNDFSFQGAGVFTPGSSVVTATGNANLSAGTYTYGTSTFVMTGDGTTLTLGANSTDFYKLHIDGNVAHAGSAIEIEGGDFQTAVGKTFTIAGTLTVKQGAIDNFSNGGIIAQSGTRTLSFTNSTSGSRTLGVNGSGDYGTISVDTVALWGYVNNAGITLQSDIENTVGEFYVRNSTAGKTTALTTDGYNVTCGSSSGGNGFRFVIAGDAELDATNGAGGATTLTSSGDVDFSGGTYTRGSSVIVMAADGNTLTSDSADNDEFTNVTINGNTTWTAAVSNYLFGVLTVANSKTLTKNGGLLYMRSTAGTNMVNNGIIKTDDTGQLSFFTWAGDADVTLTSTPGTLQLPIRFQVSSGTVDRTYTLGANFVPTSTITIGDAHTGETKLDTDSANNYNLGCNGLVLLGSNATPILMTNKSAFVNTGTTAINKGTMQTAADADGGGWTFQDDVTVSGTIQATISTGTSTFDINMSTGKSITASTTSAVINFSGAAGKEVRVLWTAANATNDFLCDNISSATLNYVNFDYADTISFYNSTNSIDLDYVISTNGNIGLELGAINSILGIDNCSFVGTRVQCWISAYASDILNTIHNCTFSGSVSTDVQVDTPIIAEFNDCTFTNLTANVNDTSAGVILDGDDAAASNDNAHVWGKVVLSNFTNTNTTSTVLTVRDDDSGTFHGEYTIDGAWAIKSCDTEDNSQLIIPDDTTITSAGQVKTSVNYISGGTLVAGVRIEWDWLTIRNTKITGFPDMRHAWFEGGVKGPIELLPEITVQDTGVMGVWGQR